MIALKSVTVTVLGTQVVVAVPINGSAGGISMVQLTVMLVGQVRVIWENNGLKEKNPKKITIKHNWTALCP